MGVIARAGFANGYHYFFEVKSPEEVYVEIGGKGILPIQTKTVTIKGAVDWIQRQTEGQTKSEDY